MKNASARLADARRIIFFCPIRSESAPQIGSTIAPMRNVDDEASDVQSSTFSCVAPNSSR